jgi:hypothetical protein
MESWVTFGAFLRTSMAKTPSSWPTQPSDITVQPWGSLAARRGSSSASRLHPTATEIPSQVLPGAALSGRGGLSGGPSRPATGISLRGRGTVPAYHRPHASPILIPPSEYAISMF